VVGRPPSDQGPGGDPRVVTVTVLTVVGARPQFVKASVVSRQLRARGEEVLVHTGQHYDAELSDVFFEQLDLPRPDHNLGVGSAPHGRQTARMIEGLEPLVEQVRPDVVLLYGDTNSTLAGAIVAAKRDVLLAHVEAGLRSHDRGMPEEVNRVLTDHAADRLFAPSERAVANLAAEGIETGVHRVGDVMYDALLHTRERLPETPPVDVVDGEYVLATVHRPRNTDDPDRLATIVDALADAPLPVVFPVHPRTGARLDEYGLREPLADELLIEPVGYLEFLRLLDGAERVVTDSGGVQKEAFFLDTPCVTLREETEWVETVECGWNVLVGADGRRLRRALDRAFVLEEKPQPYGDGDAAERIVEVLVDAC
jgi:UDP-GlcNAc3NAcA epimerase